MPHREVIDEDEDDDDDDDDDFTFVFATRRYEWLSFIVMQLYKRGGQRPQTNRVTALHKERNDCRYPYLDILKAGPEI